MPFTRLKTALKGALTGQPSIARWWRGMLLVLLCVVTVLALTPSPPKGADLGWDKLNHLAAFGTLAVVAALAYAGAMLPVALALLAYGGLIEVLQLLTPTRQAEWADLAADGLGIAVGLAVVALLARLLRPAARDG